MGCYIHILVEEKIDGKWKALKESYKVDKEEDDEDKEYNYYSLGPYQTPFYFGRSYNSFSILADVRNGYGFAGVDTGDGFEPIDEPRGIPVDASEVFQKACEQWEGDAHSHSYFYLKELKDWKAESANKTTKIRGVITLDQYKKRLENNETGEPTGGYAGGVSGRNAVTLTEREARGVIKVNNIHDHVEYYVKVEWEETYESAAPSLFEYIDMLTKYQEENDLCHNCLRICFFFDN